MTIMPLHHIIYLFLEKKKNHGRRPMARRWVSMARDFFSLFFLKKKLRHNFIFTKMIEQWTFYPIFVRFNKKNSSRGG
jgi:hypothetical protein